MRLYFSWSYKYRKFMKHIENWLALKSFLGFASSVHGERACTLGQALIQQIRERTNTGHTQTHKNQRSHLFSCTPHKQHLWFNVNYVYNWLNPYTSRQTAFHLFLSHKRKRKIKRKMKRNNIRDAQKNIRISRLRSFVPPLLSTKASMFI